MKPTVYLETSIVSYLTSRPSNDIRVAANQNTTIEDVRILGKALISRGALPLKAEIDSYHIAVAAAHGIEYLLTWNCTHIANAAMRSKIESLCREFGYEPPIICTPQELMEG